MPCYDPRSGDTSAENYRKVQLLTRLLCENCKYLLARGMSLSDQPDLEAWYQEHQLIDALLAFQCKHARTSRSVLRGTYAPGAVSLLLGYGEGNFDEFIQRYPDFCVQALLEHQQKDG